MVDYACGHKTDGLIILDDNIMSMTVYLMWEESVGLNGTKEQCFDCYIKENKIMLSNEDKTYIQGIKEGRKIERQELIEEFKKMINDIFYTPRFFYPTVSVDKVIELNRRLQELKSKRKK